jgi:transmembrane sensor
MSAHQHHAVSSAGSDPGSTAAINARASEWLIRRDVGLEPAAQRELDAWLAANPRHQAVFAELEGTWAVFERAQRKGIADGIVANLEARSRARRRRRAVTAATMALVLLGAAGLYRHVLRTPPSALAAAAGTVRTLPDGSVVELNADAAIAVDYTSDFRRVRLLRGTAHFRVEKDPQRSFLVSVGPVEVRAVGTAFTVQLHSRGVEVVVAEGRVAVNHETRDNAEQKTSARPLAYMDAETRLMLDFADAENRAPESGASTAMQLDERLSGRIQRIEFSGMHLGEAVAAMNRENRLQILLEGDISPLRISGNFRTENPEGFARIVAATLGLRIERHSESEIVLRRNTSRTPSP